MTGPHTVCLPLHIFPIVEVEFDGFALVDVKIREPNGKHKQNEQQKEFELLADLLQRKAHPHHSNITHSVENSDACPFSVDVVQRRRDFLSKTGMSNRCHRRCVCWLMLRCPVSILTAHLSPARTIFSITREAAHNFCH